MESIDNSHMSFHSLLLCARNCAQIFYMGDFTLNCWNSITISVSQMQTLRPREVRAPVLAVHQVSQLPHYWHSGMDNSLWWGGAACCLVGCLAAALTSTHEMPGVPPTPSWDNQKCLQILSHVSWWQNGSRVRSLDLSFSRNVPGLQNREDEQEGSGLAFLGHLTYIVYQGSMQEFTCHRIPRLEGYIEIHSSD